MDILVVNDDGIEAYGIKLLAQSAGRFGNVYVVAPETEQSAIGHGITIHNPMKLRERKDFCEGIKAWSLDGKPADCVKFAIYGLGLKVDLVLSGVNNGPNLGTDIIYSGTLAGASEAVILGYPAIAVSTDFGHFGVVEKELDCILEKLVNKDILDNDTVINVNFPDGRFDRSKGIRLTEQGHRPFFHEYEPDGDLYWSRGTWQEFENKPDTDVHAYENGYISITPIQINRTNYKYLEFLKDKLKNSETGCE